MTSHSNYLLHAYAFDGNGGAVDVTHEALRHLPTGDRPLWIHLDRGEEQTRHWLEENTNVDPMVIDALVDEDTRPRSSPVEGGLIVILRGVNLNPQADAEDMVSIRIWLETDMIVTLRDRRLFTIEDLEARFRRYQGPKTAPGLLVQLAEILVDRLGPKIEELDERMDSTEQAIFDEQDRQNRHEIAEIRREAIEFRRHLAPQRDALVRLAKEKVLFTDRHRTALHEIAEQLSRELDNLNHLRERTHVAHDELSSQLTEELNNRLYVLSLVTVVFLPLGLVAGLLGANVGGIPGAEHPMGFWIMSTVVGVVAGLQLYWLKRKGWM